MNPNTPGSSTNDATPVSTLGSLSSTRTARSLFGQMLVGSGMSPLGKALGQNHLAIGTKNCRWNGLASVVSHGHLYVYSAVLYECTKSLFQGGVVLALRHPHR